MCGCNSHDAPPASAGRVWRPDDKEEAKPARPGSSELYRPDILETIEATIKELDPELRELSLDIHGEHFESGSSADRVLTSAVVSASRTWL